MFQQLFRVTTVIKEKMVNNIEVELSAIFLQV